MEKRPVKRTSARQGQRSDIEIKKVKRSNTGKNPPKKMVRRKKRRGRMIGRIFQIGLVAALAVVLFFVIRNFGEGNKLNNKGMEAYERADYETANTYFGKAIQYDGNNGKYHLNLGMAQSELKLYEDAMASFNRALELMGSDKDIQLAYRGMGISLMYQGKYAEALEAFDKALDGKEKRFTNTEIDILYYKAETEDKAGMYVEAVLTYTWLVEQEKSAEAYMLRGLEYVKVGDSSSAESDLRTAIKKDKKNYEVYMALYDALMAQNKTKEAEDVLHEALELGGNRASDLVNQGNIHLKLQDYDLAESCFVKALDKGHGEAHLGYAKLYMLPERLNYAEAAAHYEAYIAEVTNNAEAFNEYGLCLMAQENFEKAEEIFTRGVALNNRLLDRTISKNQIAAAERAGHWDKALEYIDIYLQKYSDDADAIRERMFIETRIR